MADLPFPGFRVWLAAKAAHAVAYRKPRVPHSTGNRGRPATIASITENVIVQDVFARAFTIS
jgi:hypothetical protein